MLMESPWMDISVEMVCSDHCCIFGCCLSHRDINSLAMKATAKIEWKCQRRAFCREERFALKAHWAWDGQPRSHAMMRAHVSIAHVASKDGVVKILCLCPCFLLVEAKLWEKKPVLEGKLPCGIQERAPEIQRLLEETV